MTDHNAEGGKKVEACAWCQHDGEPTITENGTAYWCSNPPCVACHYGWPLSLGFWNDMQRRILEQRRKDFNAGYAFANHMERCSGEPDFIWSYAPKFYNYEDDGRPEEIDAFEMYLEKDRK